MPKNHAHRRLAAILAADVVGYSRLMGLDEEATRNQFNALLDDVIEPQIGAHHGRIVKTMGDGLLVEYSSAIDAVRCAVEIQATLAEESIQKSHGSARHGSGVDSETMIFRIGINLGDVIVEGDDIHGDGVNVAARLEALAEPGGILVAGIVHEIVRTKVDFAFFDIGPQAVKNIAEPVPAYGVGQPYINKPAGKPAIAAAVAANTAPAVPEKPSIAVLPFANPGGDPEQQYFCDGITEDLITDLSKISGLFVVGRNASFAIQAQINSTREAAERLGVRHILEGSVRRAGNKVRVNAELVDGQTSGQLWADRFDGEFDDIFALQDDINARIVAALKQHLTPDVAEPASRRSTPDPQAYDLCLKGRSEYYLYKPQRLAAAAKFFEQAIAIDPDYAEPYAYLSYCRNTAYVFGWPGADDTLDGALALAQKAIDLDPGFAVGYARRGWIEGFLGRRDDAIASFHNALELEPRNAEAIYSFGETMNRLGSPEQALPLLEKAFSIDTFVPPAWEFARGHSYILLGRYDDAVAAILPVIERVPGFVPGRVQLVRAYHELGRSQDASAMVQSIRKIAPIYSQASATRMFPYPDDDNRLRLRTALADAGLPQ